MVAIDRIGENVRVHVGEWQLIRIQGNFESVLYAGYAYKAGVIHVESILLNTLIDEGFATNSRINYSVRWNIKQKVNGVWLKLWEEDRHTYFYIEPYWYTGADDFFNWDEASNAFFISPDLLQNRNDELVLPRYPYAILTNFNVCVAVGASADDITFNFVDDTATLHAGETQQLASELGNAIIRGRLHAGDSLKYTANGEAREFAQVIDARNIPYFLQWRDRTGGVQCQPFMGKCTFAENIENTDIIDLYGNSRTVQKRTSGKWTINTDFTTEQERRTYESILTSKSLFLYDIQNHLGYDVKCTDKQFQHKTWQTNGRKYFNFECNLETIGKKTI